MDTSDALARQTDRIAAAVISLTATSEIEKNWLQALSALDQAADQGAEWIQLPEMWSFMGDYRYLASVAEDDRGKRLQTLCEWAKKRKVVLFCGSLVELPSQTEDQDNKYYNTLYVIDRDGAVIGKYRKIHLFNLRGKDGQKSHCESDGYLAGSHIECIDVDGFKVMLSICYDLRFGALYTTALNRYGPFDVIVAPSAFTRYTGEAHWELMLRSRAVEFQCYMFAANQVGDHGNGKQSYGHGMLVDPWGRVVVSTGSTPSIAHGFIERKKIQEVREQLPALWNRREDLYGR